MTGPAPRTIMRSSPSHLRDLAQVLQSACIAELLAPSRRLWLAAPVLGNAAILDNRDGAFTSLRPLWSHRLITLTDFLLGAMEAGTQVVVATSVQGELFLDRLQAQTRESGLDAQLRIVRPTTLPYTGLLLEGWLLSGALVFTADGVRLDEEKVSVDMRPDRVAEIRAAFIGAYGESA